MKNTSRLFTLNTIHTKIIPAFTKCPTINCMKFCKKRKCSSLFKPFWYKAIDFKPFWYSANDKKGVMFYHFKNLIIE